jgi:hypothetical protein
MSRRETAVPCNRLQRTFRLQLLRLEPIREPVAARGSWSRRPAAPPSPTDGDIDARGRIANSNLASATKTIPPPGCTASFGLPRWGIKIQRTRFDAQFTGTAAGSERLLDAMATGACRRLCSTFSVYDYNLTRRTLDKGSPLHLGAGCLRPRRLHHLQVVGGACDLLAEMLQGCYFR